MQVVGFYNKAARTVEPTRGATGQAGPDATPSLFRASASHPRAHPHAGSSPLAPPLAPAAQSQCCHACQRELPQVTLLHPAGDQGHGDVSLDAVHTHPGGHQRQDAAQTQPEHTEHSTAQHATANQQHRDIVQHGRNNAAGVGGACFATCGTFMPGSSQPQVVSSRHRPVSPSSV